MLKRLRLDDLRTGDSVRVRTTNSTYVIDIVGAQSRTADISGGRLEAPSRVHLVGNPEHIWDGRRAIDVGRVCAYTRIGQRGRRANADMTLTSAVTSIEHTLRDIGRGPRGIVGKVLGPGFRRLLRRARKVLSVLLEP